MVSALTADALDALVGLPGFGSAAATVGWLEFTETGAKLPNFAEYNSPGAKARLASAKRVQRHRNGDVTVDRYKSVPRQRLTPRQTPTLEENSSAAAAAGESVGKPTKKRAKEKPPDDADFTAFWAVYPKRAGKGEARTAFTKAVGRLANAGQAEPAAMLIARAKAFATAQRGADPKFVPFPATWLNKERYDDDPATWNVNERAGQAQPYRNKQNSNLDQYQDYLQRNGLIDDQQPFGQSAGGGQGCDSPVQFLESRNGSGPH